VLSQRKVVGPNDVEIDPAARYDRGVLGADAAKEWAIGLEGQAFGEKDYLDV